MKQRLYLCIKNPLVERDFERFGIAQLSQSYDLRILDCTAWLMPAAFKTRGSTSLSLANLYHIARLSEFKAAVDKGGFALDFIGPFSPSAIVMFDTLRRRGVKLIVIDSGACPTPDALLGRKSIARKVFDALRHGGLRAHLLARVNQVLLKLLPDQRPDIALVAGDSWRSDPRFTGARRQINAHSFDYERYHTVRANSLPQTVRQLPPFAVYLDEDIAGHEDNIEMGFANPTTEERFYPALNRFFDRFEQETQLRVVIAGYPSRKLGDAKRFGGRLVFFDLTPELISASQAVFAHASTAISFAVLWRRPLTFLTSKDIAASWYGAWIEAPRSVLNAPLLDIDVDHAHTGYQQMDEAGYAAYERTYLVSANSPDASLWETLRQATLEQATQKLAEVST